MPEDVETIRQWTLVALTIAAVPITAFPLLYFIFSPWYKSQLGRAMLLKSFSVALAIDFSVVYRYWTFTDNLRALLITWFFIVIFIGVGATYQLSVLIWANFVKPWKERNNGTEPAGEDSGTAESSGEQHDV